MQLYSGNVTPDAVGAVLAGGRKGETQEAIRSKVGLSFDQFTRAVLLAQNEFAAFLKAGDSDRAEILQALTGTNRFERLSKAAFDRCRREELAVQTVRLKLAGQAPLSAEDRSLAETAAHQAEAEFRGLKEKITARERHLEWFRLSDERAEQVKLAGQQCQDAQRAQSDAAPRRSELALTEMVGRQARPLVEAERRSLTTLQAAEKDAAQRGKMLDEARLAGVQRASQRELATKGWQDVQTAWNAARVPLLQARELDLRLRTTKDSLARASREREEGGKARAQVFTQQQRFAQELESGRRELEQVRPVLAAQAALAPFVPEAAAWLDRLRHAGQRKKDWLESQRQLTAHQQSVATLRQQIAGMQTRLQTEQQSVEAKQLACTAAEQAAAQYDAAAMAQARREAQAKAKGLRELTQRLVEVERWRKEDAEFHRRMAETQALLDGERQQREQVQQQAVPEAESTLKAARRALEIAEAAVTDASRHLRTKLEPDVPCPVCGSREHPYATEQAEALDAVLKTLRTEVEAANSRLIERQAQVAAWLKGEALHRAELEKTQKHLAALAPRLEEGAAFLSSDPLALAWSRVPESDRGGALASWLTEAEATLARLDEQEDLRIKAERHRDQLRIARDTARTQFAALEKEAGQLAGHLQGATAKSEAATTEEHKAAAAWSSALAGLEPWFQARPGWQAGWEAAPEPTVQQSEREFSDYAALEKRQAGADKRCREAQAALGPLAEALAQADQQLVIRADTEKHWSGEASALQMQRQALFAGRGADEVEGELQQKLQQAITVRDQAQAAVIESDKRIGEFAATLQQTQTDLESHRSALLAAQVALGQWVQQQAEAIPGLTRALLDQLLARDEAWLHAEKVALAALDAAVERAQGQLSAHQRQLETHAATRPTPDERPVIEGELQALRSRGIEVEAQRDAAKLRVSKDDDLRREQSRLVEELELAQAAALPWQRLSELIGSADGAKFRGIAQRRTLEFLLGYANAQLELLNARYRLERLPESLNLIIVDREMGDERRSIHSLSGGESFLVSLALALALASLTSNRLQIESLFIDEGFGSLDADTLNVAMGALMRLEAQGRKVGVISHVTELADAIPVQIRVLKGRGGTSRLVVPGAAPVIPPASPVQTSPAAREKNIVEPARLLVILQRERAAGRLKVSSQAIREELGCTVTELTAAREALGMSVRLEGRSIVLVVEGES